MSNGLIQVVAGVNVKYINNVPHVLLGLKPRGEWEFPLIDRDWETLP